MSMSNERADAQSALRALGMWPEECQTALVRQPQGCITRYGLHQPHHPTDAPDEGQALLEPKYGDGMLTSCLFGGNFWRKSPSWVTGHDGYV